MFKVQEIREIIKLIDQSSITTFKYETDEATVTLKKETAAAVTAPANPTPVVVETQEAPKAQEKAAPAPVKQAEKVEENQEEAESNAGSTDYDYEIVSPMVGTFYEAPSPEDDPYVSVGDAVQTDTIVCIVEAMKLFNEIEAEVDGEIVEKLVKDGELVEYGQPLFRVKKK